MMRASTTTFSGPQSPEKAEALPVPFHDGVWFYQHHDSLRAWPDTIEQHPKAAVNWTGVFEFSSPAAAAKHRQLMTERNDLQLQRSAASKSEFDQGNERREKGVHERQNYFDRPRLQGLVVVVGLIHHESRKRYRERDFAPPPR
jgi:hypothetical protein